jgi:predicted transcriptional regulator YdeE
MKIEPFTVAGWAARTTNIIEMGGEGAIPKLWGQLGRRDGDITAVYYDYASDKDGEYSYLLGTKVGPAEEIPPSLVSREVAGGDYSKFSGGGPNPAETVVRLWQEIWAQEKTGLGRAYRTDFEVYHPNGDVDIYIGLSV